MKFKCQKTQQAPSGHLCDTDYILKYDLPLEGEENGHMEEYWEKSAWVILY